MNRHERRRLAKLARQSESESKRLEINRRLVNSIGVRAAALAMCGPDTTYKLLLHGAVGLERVMSEEQAMEVVNADHVVTALDLNMRPYLAKGLTVGIGLAEQFVSVALAGALYNGDSEKMAGIVRDFAKCGVGEGRRELEVMRMYFTCFDASQRQEGREAKLHPVVEVLDRAIALYDFEDGTEPEGLPS